MTIASTLETFLSLQSISIPLRKADSGDDNTAQFQLDCSTIQSAGQQGQMDCIQQPGGSSNIRTVGTITHKINVKATDDSYQMTQQRMKEAEEERKGVRYSNSKVVIITVRPLNPGHMEKKTNQSKCKLRAMGWLLLVTAK